MFILRKGYIWYQSFMLISILKCSPLCRIFHCWNMWNSSFYLNAYTIVPFYINTFLVSLQVLWFQKTFPDIYVGYFSENRYSKNFQSPIPFIVSLIELGHCTSVIINWLLLGRNTGIIPIRHVKLVPSLCNVIGTRSSLEFYLYIFVCR